MRSVNEKIEALVRHRGRFASSEQGWANFLDYLEARQGVGLRRDREVRLREIRYHLEYVEGLCEDPRARRDDFDAALLAEFGRRQDVIESFRGFLGWIGHRPTPG
jgi:hypothetical protein